MGLGSSKVDAYVLKVIDDSVVRDVEMTHRKSKHQPLSASDSHIKQQHHRGSMNRKNSKVSVQHAASLSDLDTHNDMIEGPHFLQKKSGTGLIGGSGAGISSKHMNNDDDTNNHHHHHHNFHSNNLSGSPLQNHHQHNHHSTSSSSSSINQSSSKLITRANSIISHSSSKYPWIMKNTNLNGTTLNDYESGKVIGMLVVRLMVIRLVSFLINIIVIIIYITSIIMIIIIIVFILVIIKFIIALVISSSLSFNIYFFHQHHDYHNH